jgi:ribosomal protein S7
MSLSPKERAQNVVRWIISRWFGRGVDHEEIVERVAEEIADAQNEIREGFLRKPTHGAGAQASRKTPEDE